MLYLIKTGNAESDAFYLHQYLSRLATPKLLIKRLPYTDETFFSFLETALASFTLFSQPTLYVLEEIPLNKQTKEHFTSHLDQDFILVNPSTRIFTEYPKEKLIIVDNPVTGADIEKFVEKQCKEKGIIYTTANIRTILDLTLTLDARGDMYYSPQQAIIITRQIDALSGYIKGKDLTEHLLLLKKQSGHLIDHWKMAEFLFCPSGTERVDYFNNLLENADVFEVLSILKDTLVRIAIILHALKLRLTSDQIATELGKNPYYISGLIRTIRENDITLEKTMLLLQRLFALETKIKNGELDDALLGFSILIATL